MATWQIKCTDGKKDAVTMSVGKTVIGRGHLLQIRELKVSRHHAEVQITENGEFVLKAMHPGLPCFYKKKGEDTRSELSRGATVAMQSGDVFSLHSNPDCEFEVIQSSQQSETDNGTGGPDGDKAVEPEIPETREDKGGEAEEDVEEPEDEEEEQASEEEQQSEGSDWDEKPVKKKRTSVKINKPVKKRATKPQKKSKSKPPPARRPPARSRRPPSSEEEVSENSEEESEEDSDYAGKRSSRRQPARNQAKLPARRTASKTVNYNEDVLYGAISSEEEQEDSDDGLPKIGRQRKRDSDSDFNVDEDSGSDWGESSKPTKRSGRPPAGMSVRGRKRKKQVDSEDEFSEEEEEYIPRPSKRRSAPTKRTQSTSEEEEEEEEEESEASE